MAVPWRLTSAGAPVRAGHRAPGCLPGARPAPHGQQQQQRCRRKTRRGPLLCRAQQTVLDSSDVDTPAFLSLDLEPQAEGEYCMPGEISTDNESSETYTKLTVEVKDYPGLIRVIAWVVNGLDLVVTEASLVTGEDGYARNHFCITDKRGRKLNNYHSELLAERVGDFVVYCTPDQKAVDAQLFENKPVAIDNSAHAKYSQVTITHDPRGHTSTLLEVASAMTGIGVIIHEATIKKSDDRNPAFFFLVTDRRGRKLDYARCSALLFTLGLVFATSSGPLKPPTAYGCKSLASVF